MLYCSKTNTNKNLGPVIAGLMITVLFIALAGAMDERMRALGALQEAVAGPAIASR